MRNRIVEIFALLALALTGVAVPDAARAQEKIRLGYTGVADYAAAFVAAEEGFFKQRGLDVELQLIQLNSTIPAAVQSGSLQIGGPTPSVFLQAVDGGLDLVAVAGGSFVDKQTKTFGVVARTGSNIDKPADFVGKKVGVPGIGAFLHVLFRKWLADNGVDAKKVTFIEVAFPQMNDILKGGTVDAVVTGEPVMNRMIAAGTGKLVSNITADLGQPLGAVLYAATRAYATSHRDAMARFREAIDQAAAFVPTNPEKARAHIAKYTRLPPEVVATVPLPTLRAKLTVEDLAVWIAIMSEQEMLRSKPDPAKLVVQ